MSSRTSATSTPARDGTSTAERTRSRTTSTDGTSSTEEGRRTDVTLAEHAAKVDRDLSRLLAHIAGLVTRIRGELPIRRDPAANRDVDGAQQPELAGRVNALYAEV